MKMKGRYRKSIFFVVYKKNKGIIYLILHRTLHWKGWEFPKAGIEKNEDVIRAIKREVKEETGLRVLDVIKFNKKGKFDYDRELPDRLGFKGQSWRLYAIEVGKGKVKIDKKEHNNYKWLKFKDALNILTWTDQKSCLKLVNKKL